MVYLLNLSNFRKVFKNRSETNENGNMTLRLHVFQTHVQIECHQKIQKQVVLAALKSYFLFVFQVYCIYFYINFIRKRINALYVKSSEFQLSSTSLSLCMPIILLIVYY